MTTSTMAPCPVCQCPLDLRLAKGRKSGKPFLCLVCPVDGRHFRGFIADRAYIERIIGEDGPL